MSTNTVEKLKAEFCYTCEEGEDPEKAYAELRNPGSTDEYINGYQSLKMIWFLPRKDDEFWGYNTEFKTFHKFFSSTFDHGDFLFRPHLGTWSCPFIKVKGDGHEYIKCRKLYIPAYPWIRKKYEEKLGRPLCYCGLGPKECDVCDSEGISLRDSMLDLSLVKESLCRDGSTLIIAYKSRDDVIAIGKLVDNKFEELSDADKQQCEKNKLRFRSPTDYELSLVTGQR